MVFHVACRADDPYKHSLDVNHILFYNKRLYTAGDDGKIKAWEADLKFINEVQAHPCSVYCLAAIKDTLYSCSNDGTIKCFDIATFKEKNVLSKQNTEFWKIVTAGDVLFVGDSDANIRIYKNEKAYGVFNVAEPPRDMIVYRNNILFSAKDNDVVVTDCHLGGENLQFGTLKTLTGRSPLALIDEKIIFASRSGRDIIINTISQEKHLKELCQSKDAHDMIINSMCGTNWDNKDILFSGGWDRTVKQWKIEESTIKIENSCGTNIVINSMALGDKGSIYAAGGDGHIIRLDI